MAKQPPPQKHAETAPPEEPPRAAQPRGSVDATFIVLTGFCAAMGGLMLCAAPQISWKLAKLAAAFQHLGLHGGAVLMGGMVLVALGVLRRGQHVLAHEIWLAGQQAQPSSPSPELEHGLRALHNAVYQLGQQVAHVQGQVGETIAMTHAVAGVVEQSASSGASQSIHHLAASFDQLALRLDHAFAASAADVAGRFSALAEQLGQALGDLEARLAQAESARAAEARAAAQPGPPAAPGRSTSAGQALLRASFAPGREPEAALPSPPLAAGADGPADLFGDDEGQVGEADFSDEALRSALRRLSEED